MLRTAERKDYSHLVMNGQGGLKSVWLQITAKCNQHCAYCYMNASRATNQRLSFNEIDTIFRKAKGLGGQVMLISGGEPTIVKELPAILRASAETYGFKTYLVTNGTGITDHLIRDLRELDVYVQVSMDSVDDEAYAKVRGLPLLSRVKRNVEKMVAENIGVALSVPITNVVDTSVVGVLDWAIECGVQNVHVSTSYSQRTGVTDDLTRQGAASVLTELYRYEKDHFYELSIDLIENMIINAAGKGEPCSTYCAPMSGRTLEVDAYGRTFYCGAITTVPEMALGNILEEDFVDRYYDRSFSSKHLLLTPDKLSICSSCEYRGICKGSCRSQALTYTGDLFGPVSHCEDLKVLYAEMMRDYRAGELDELIAFLAMIHGPQLTAQTKCF
ncbi:MAG: radical SAM protein [Rhizomicrobium sp.]